MPDPITPRVTPGQARDLAERMCRNLGIDPHGYSDGRALNGKNWERFRNFAELYLAADLGLQDMLGSGDSAGPRDMQGGR